MYISYRAFKTEEEAEDEMGHIMENREAYENALKIAPLNFLYYQNVVKSYKMEGLLQEKIQQYKALEETNSLYKVLLGLCYIENGDTKRGIIKLDEFCMQEPYLIITNGVKRYLRETLKLNY